MIVEFSNVLSQSDDEVLSEHQTDPHIINEVRYNWMMKSELMKITETLRQWIERKKDYIKSHKLGKHIDGIVIYDWQPCMPMPQLNTDMIIYTHINKAGKPKLESSGIIRYAYLSKKTKI